MRGGDDQGHVTRFAVATAILGAASLAWTVVAGEMGSLDLETVLLFGATSLSVAIPLRFHRRGGVDGITLDEAMLVAMLFALPSGQPALVLTLSSLTHVAMRSAPVKVAYNAGNTALSASAATLLFHHIGAAPSVLHPRSLVAVISSVAVYNVVSSLSFAELVRRLEGQARRDTIGEVWRLNLVTLVGNTTSGLLLALVVLVEPLASVLAALLLVGLYLGYRGFAGVIEDRDRTDRLHEAALVLAAGTGSESALPDFLGRLVDLFGAERSELVTIASSGTRTLHQLDGSEIADVGRVSDPLEAALQRRGQVRVSISASSGAAQYRDALAAPLVVDGAVIGALAVYDRIGLEAWDDADATLLATLAHEAAVAIRNADLVTTLSEESRKLGDIVGAASDGIVLLDPAGTVQSWNPGMTRATGVDEDAALGRRWDQVVPHDPDDDGLRAAIEATLTRGWSGAVDLPLAMSSERRWLRCTLSPVLSDGGVGGAVLICRDVTAQLEADALKADFVATVTHELRTPLTPLKGFIATMSQRWMQFGPEQVDSALAAMSRQVERLETLVADLLVVADLGRGQTGVASERVDVASVVTEAIGAAAIGGDQRRVELSTRPAHAETDPRHVARILQALVSNALKHTDGAVRVSVERAGDRVTVAVADDGQGIAAWDHERIFQPFGRTGDHLVRPTQGPGLGLAIARSLSEAIDGELTVRSRPGEGATFTLRLPATDLVTAVA